MSFFRIIPVIGTLFILLSTYLFSTQCAAESLQSIVETRLYSHFTAKTPGSDINIVVNDINDQINSKKCEKFTIPLPDKLPSGGRLSLRVNCNEPEKWMVYVSARVDIFALVAVVKRPILKGSRLRAADVYFTRQNTSSLNQGYFTKPERLINLTARRSIPAGTLLTANMLLIPELIQRGDIVIIEIVIGSLSVRTQGTALQSGKQGEQIKVLNNKSQREIHAYVQSRGVVSVSP
ncbi:flagellar basal body P-ring formation chaperone FlgA [Neptunomonas antarctica]|uniref:Flagella basal body P-ring formation protein FlgA n=1 Tax=Neptunomonas antarctica TaxID=619304 RepID=A0A1N7JBN9_9GAMM|nr:flagellar basal body P-ring formation chaperone FlgA [Neptunomonas antarctica]SIS46681.1 flagella basal body P-ring formation protein FlgA [Neptunomonas antarctica]